MKEALKMMKEKFYSSASSDITSIIDGSLEVLIKEKLAENALSVGDKMPEFALTNAIGNRVKLKNLLKKGPIVITFYRGGW